MPKVKDPTAPYAGRRLDCVVINTTLDYEAVQVLHRYCQPGRKNTGKFFARLLYEHDARVAARVAEQEKFRHAMQGVLGEEVAGE